MDCRGPAGYVGGMHRLLLVLFLLAGACARPADPGLRLQVPHPELPEGVERRAETFTGAGGVELFSQSLRPRDGEVRAVLVIHHGLKDHGDRYTAFATRLAGAGYAVYTMDMRGHGRSAGQRVVAGRFDDYVDDLSSFVERVRAHEPDRPVFVLGHSLGGLITTLYAMERQPPIHGIILSAPAISSAEPVLGIGLIRTIGAIAPGAPLFGVENADFSSSRTVVEGMDRDPLIHQDPAPISTAAAMLGAWQRVWAGAGRLTTPLLALHGTADLLTAPAGSRELVARAGSADRTLEIYDGLHHDLLNEPDSEQVAADIVAWMDARTGGAQPGVRMPPPRPLSGDGGPGATSLDIDLRGERFDDAGNTLAITGGLRAGVALGKPVGYFGAVDLRIGAEDGLAYQASGCVAGVALRLGRGGQLSLCGGIGVLGARGENAVRVPAELSLELPLGPTRALVRGTLGWHLTGDLDGDAFGIADDAGALVALRLGRDHGYWADVNAGRGLYLGATYRELGDVSAWGLALGLDLWGAN
jgi:acylglycerol lipase